MLGYCTNVHAGPDLAQTQANLQTHAEAVKRQCSPDAPMGVGLWLAAPAAAELSRSPRDLLQLRNFLESAGLVPFTMNGFPFGDFHQPIVKHAVYKPTWDNPERLEYTRQLVEIQHQLLPSNMPGTISTLPIGWGNLRADANATGQAAANLATLAESLRQLADTDGREIAICIEPEPGCVMDRAEHIVAFFENQLLPLGDEQSIRDHIRVCHDICHSAVMFEEQSHAVESYRQAGIQIGKVQVSSAVALRLDELEPEDRAIALAQLAEFDEPRYLHQTSHREASGDTHFFEDLEPALTWLNDEQRQTGEVRVHFHVPIYLESFGALQTTREQVLECLACVDSAMGKAKHFEVETYAWSVLPSELQHATLADGIAQEMQWFQSIQ